MQPTVCVLHDSRDGLLARRIAKDLGARGISARADLGVMRIGESRETHISEGVLTASVILVLITPRSARAPLLTDRAARDVWAALTAGRRVIVGCAGTDRVPARLADEAAVDFTDYDEGLDALAALI
jgi:hypothetical protein